MNDGRNILSYSDKPLGCHLELIEELDCLNIVDNRQAPLIVYVSCGFILLACVLIALIAALLLWTAILHSEWLTVAVSIFVICLCLGAIGLSVLDLIHRRHQPFIITVKNAELMIIEPGWIKPSRKWTCHPHEIQVISFPQLQYYGGGYIRIIGKNNENRSVFKGFSKPELEWIGRELRKPLLSVSCAEHPGG
jgi:hypothetical protein